MSEFYSIYLKAYSLGMLANITKQKYDLPDTIYTNQAELTQFQASIALGVSDASRTDRLKTISEYQNGIKELVE